MGFTPCVPCLERLAATSVRARESALHARYLDACLLDSLRRGEAPFASHGLYTRAGVLDDLEPGERDLGIRAGFEWRYAASVTAVYLDLGTSSGMRAGVDHATEMMRAGIDHVVQYRHLDGEWARPYEELLMLAA